ncbi:SSI family serine proteinase inhibitor [Streptomyces sp. NPDC050095]|uniref:SSI family serine proteinase inhibitor n=1 Tax=unclassified Streptomyces TaxID=2593676 RepID=UPI0034426EF8
MALLSGPVSLKVRKPLLALAAAGTLLATATGTAQAAPQQQKLPGNWVYVAVMQGDAGFGDMKGTLLRCPARKAELHPQAARACRELARVGGDINRIHVKDTVCPMIYKPVTAAAYGMWNGRRVVYARNFSNDCVMGASTGSVFKIA